jgi:aspartate aminotransferase
MPEQNGVARFLVNNDAVTAYLTTFKQELYFRLRKIYEEIQEMKLEGLPIDAIEPKAGIYLSICIKHRNHTPASITSLLLEEAGLGILPFHVFGTPPSLSWFRLSVGTCHKSDMHNMLYKLRAAL